MSTQTDPHLNEAQFEQIVTGAELTAERMAHAEQCAVCRAALQTAKRLYNETEILLSGGDGMDDLLASEAISQMVARAMVHAPPVFSRRAWWANMALGTLFTSLAGLAFLALEMPRAMGTLRQLSAFRSVPRALFRTIELGVPGGWATVALVGIGLLFLIMLPLRRPLRSVHAGVSTMLGAPLFGILLLISAPLVVQAQDTAPQVEEAFSDLKPVTLQLEQVAVDDALGQVCEAAGLGYVSRSRTLASRPPIPSLRFRNTPVREALLAIVGDAPVTIERRGTLVTVEDRSDHADADKSPTAPIIGERPDQVDAKKDVEAPGENEVALPRKQLGKIFAFGENRIVRKDEVATSVTVIGGNATIEGLVLGDVSLIGGNADISGTVEGDLVTTGGNATVSGRIEGDAAAMGGNISVVDEGEILGEIGAVGGNIKGSSERSKNQHFAHKGSDRKADDEDSGYSFGGFLHSFINHLLIFLIGLFMMGMAGTRFGEMKRALAATPLHTLGFGILGFFGAVILTVVLCITLIGIPIALCVIVLSFAAFFVGLAATAATIGQVLPLPQLSKRPIAQLALGIAILFVLSIIPMGKLLLIGLAVAGFGAVVLTRFGGRPYPSLSC